VGERWRLRPWGTNLHRGYYRVLQGTTGYAGYLRGTAQAFEVRDTATRCVVYRFNSGRCGPLKDEDKRQINAINAMCVGACPPLI
jgi:hypothetical protein